MSAPVVELEDAVQLVQVEIQQATKEGRKAPGRPTLIERTGLNEYWVRRALEELARRAGDDAPAGSSEPPSDPDVPPGRGPDSEDTAGRPAVADGTSGRGVEPAGELDPAGERAHQPVSSARPRGGKAVAWCGFIVGSVVSIAANVLAARIPPEGAGPDWSPRLDTQLGAAVWPVLLIIAVEVLSRTRWPEGLGWALARYCGVGLVAVVGAVISYGHIHDVLLSWNYAPLGALVGPLGVDGLMVVCGFAMLAPADTGRTPAGSSAGSSEVGPA
ncbi:DUF2637 domain-containing protein [Amycolatopsis sp. NPDC006125]|uniref:DUF2637 domain-containing protein n=1 Tax=Amycolatopsis sp. NPDC006125 TaxID=3156730 RepID=UPI0033AEF62B